MRWITKRKATALVGGLAIAALSLVGCTDRTDEPQAEPSSSTAAPTPTDTPVDAARSDEQKLPIPVDEISDWADTAVPRSTDTSGTGTLAGWLSENTSPRHVTTFSSLPPGSFQAQLACRGGGVITLTAAEADDPDAGEPVTCDDSTIAFDVTTEQTGMSVVLVLSGDPTIYAVSFERMS